MGKFHRAARNFPQNLVHRPAKSRFFHYRRLECWLHWRRRKHDAVPLTRITVGCEPRQRFPEDKLLSCSCEREKTLTRRVTKTGYTSSKASRQALQSALMRGILLSLLFTHQAWAGIICHCALKSESQHACCQTAHRSLRLTGADADIHHSSPCSDESEPLPDDQRKGAPQGEEACCYVSRQAEARTVEISLLNPAPVEEGPPDFDVTGLKASTTECIRVLKPRLSRPLYLIHSSLLI